jgi:hypothetical protein
MGVVMTRDEIKDMGEDAEPHWLDSENGDKSPPVPLIFLVIGLVIAVATMGMLVASLTNPWGAR